MHASAERGFSFIKAMLCMILLVVAFQPVSTYARFHYINWKVQSVFDGIVINMASADVAEVQRKLPELLELQHIEAGDLPGRFFEKLKITRDANGLHVASEYHETIWVLGDVKAVDVDGSYVPATLSGLDVWRDRAAIDLHFQPHAGHYDAS